MTPEALAERQNALEHAVALLLQTLTPNQRAAYVLREAFGYSYDQIGDLLHLSVTNARQQVSRAQDRLDNRRHRQHVDAVTHRRLVQAIFTAARTGDLGQLERVLTHQDAPGSDLATSTHVVVPRDTTTTGPSPPRRGEGRVTRLGQGCSRERTRAESVCHRQSVTPARPDETRHPAPTVRHAGRTTTTPVKRFPAPLAAARDSPPDQPVRKSLTTSVNRSGCSM